ncbi:MAG: hypothetical protein ACYC55_02765 [Candidatus Geothermincolia bacterium]
MEERNYIPGPAKAMYWLYAGLLALVLYTGFNLLHPFVQGWRYPWGMGLMRAVNFHFAWALVLVAVVYMYYSTLGRPRHWKEPLGWFRLLLVAMTIWFFLLTYAVYRPWGWLQGFVSFLGGPIRVFMWYEGFLWVMLLATLIYAYSRWAVSPRYPHLRETAPAKEGV